MSYEFDRYQCQGRSFSKMAEGETVQGEDIESAIANLLHRPHAGITTVYVSGECLSLAADNATLRDRIAELEAALAHQTRCREDSDRKAMESEDALNATAHLLAEVREDAARLDWLESKGLTTNHNEDGRTRDYGVHSWFNFITNKRGWTARYISSDLPTLRAAIDAARRKP